MSKRRNLSEDGLVSRLSHLDKSLSECFFIGDKGFLTRGFLLGLEFSAHGVLWLAGISYLFLYSSSGSTDQEVYLNLLLALVLDLCVVGLSKVFFARERPHYNHDDMYGTVAVDRFSFPSGHATRTALLSSLFCYLLDHGKIHPGRLLPGLEDIGDGFYGSVVMGHRGGLEERLAWLERCVVGGWCILTAFSRVMLGRHHMFDVFMGILIGVATFKLTVYLWIQPDFAQVVHAEAVQKVNLLSAKVLGYSLL
eukprot:Nk52_evm4s261 gene=Nk52_evmTU4s261